MTRRKQSTKKPQIITFLQEHYNTFRRSGGTHSHYVAWNELSDEMGEKLARAYVKMYPKPVSPAKIARYKRNLSG